jgi:hypothetical protein
VDEPSGSSTQADDYSSSAPSEGIIGGFDLREPLHADGMDLRNPVLEGHSLDVFLDLAILELAFEGDELPLLERLGEPREMAPGKDAIPFGTGLVVSLIVLPTLLGCDAEDELIPVVLSAVLAFLRSVRDGIERGTLHADRQVKPEGSRPVQRFCPHGR